MEKELKKVLKKATVDRNTVNILKSDTTIEIDKTKEAKDNFVESNKHLERRLDQYAANISKRENIKIAIENKILTN